MRYIMIFIVLLAASTAMADQRSSLYLLTSADANKLYSSFHHSLASSMDHQAVEWSNPVTGLSGSTVPIRSYQTNYGQLCREYISSVQLAGSIQQAVGTACRQVDGGWKIAGEKLIQRSHQSLKFVYVSSPQQRVGQGCLHSDGISPQVQQRMNRLQQVQQFHSEEFLQMYRKFHHDLQSVPNPRRFETKPLEKLIKLVAD